MDRSGISATKVHVIEGEVLAEEAAKQPGKMHPQHGGIEHQHQRIRTRIIRRRSTSIERGMRMIICIPTSRTRMRRECRMLMFMAGR